MINWLNNWTNITGVIAIAGFLLSVASWARTLWAERKNIEVSFDFESRYMDTVLSSKYLTAAIAVSIENKSSNSIAVTFIELLTKTKEKYRANLEPGFVARKHTTGYVRQDYERFIESAKFPLQICPLGAAYEYILFSLPKDRDWEDIEEIIVQTNRGRIVISDAETICRLQEFLQKPIRERRETQGAPQ